MGGEYSDVLKNLPTLPVGGQALLKQEG